MMNNKIVAEIEKCYNECLKRAKVIDSDYWNAKAEAYRNVLVIIDNNIEVKKVDLEKKINKYISDNFFGSETIGFFANRTKEEPNDQDIALCAKRFFELGMRVSNKV